MFKICQKYKFQYRVRNLLDGKFLRRCQNLLSEILNDMLKFTENKMFNEMLTLYQVEISNDMLKLTGRKIF